MHKDSREGFGTLEILLIILVIALLVGAGVFFYSRQSKDSSKTDSSQTTSSVVSAKTTPHTNEKGGFSVDIPEGWSVVDDNQESLYLTKITSQNGTIVAIGATNGGGRGGCTANEAFKLEDAVPHSATNPCPTLEILDTEELTTVIDDEPLQLVKLRYTEQGTDKSQYILSVRDGDFNNFFKNADDTNSKYTYDGFIDRDEIGNTSNYVMYVTPRGQSEDYFNTADIKQAEDIFRSFYIINPTPFSS